MYLPGHDAIMSDILKNLTSEERSFIDTEPLRRGLHYPDLPCGKYDIVDNKYVFMTQKTTCNLLNLLQLYDPQNNEFYEIFQSHKGILAYLHSMTPNPSFTVGDVRDTILIQICGFFILAIYDSNVFNKKAQKNPDVFWLGAILHVMMDSYSPAHAIRSDVKKITVPPRSPYTPSRIMRKRIRDVILATIKAEMTAENGHADHGVLDTKESFAAAIKDRFKGDATATAFIVQHQDQLYNSFLNFTFDTQTQKRAKYFLGKPNVIPKAQRGKYDIRNFMYYNNQFNFYHQRKDFLFNITRNPELYKKMIDECAFVVRLFIEAVRPATPKNTKYFVQTLYTFLYDNTYRIAVDDAAAYTGPLDLD